MKTNICVDGRTKDYRHLLNTLQSVGTTAPCYLINGDHKAETTGELLAPGREFTVLGLVQARQGRKFRVFIKTDIEDGETSKPVFVSVCHINNPTEC